MAIQEIIIMLDMEKFSDLDWLRYRISEAGTDHGWCIGMIIEFLEAQKIGTQVPITNPLEVKYLLGMTPNEWHDLKHWAIERGWRYNVPNARRDRDSDDQTV